MPNLPSELSTLMDPAGWGFDVLDARWLVMAIGVVLVLFGSRFYKLLLVTPGFVAGVLAALDYVSIQDQFTRAGVAIVAGIVGAGVLLYVERVALAVIGAAVFGGLAYAVVPLVMGPRVDWTVMAAIAVLGAIGFPFVYRWSLPVVTPLVGSIAIAWALEQPHNAWLIVGLGFMGAVLQLTLTGKKSD